MVTMPGLAVAVAVGVGVLVVVGVPVGMGVPVGVGVAFSVGVPVGTGVLVGVGVMVAVGVLVGVAVAPPFWTFTVTEAVATCALLLLYARAEIVWLPFETPAEFQVKLNGGEDAR
jgi:hypothetical protein